MTIIVVPTEKCNCKCKYCFEPDEVHKGLGVEYDFDAMKKSLEQIWGGRYHHSSIALHGGECTLIPFEEFEKLVSLIYNLPWKRSDGTVGRKGAVSIVTNGTLITDKHIELFKKYNVHVAISVDGSPDLNILRGPDPSDKQVTRVYNLKVNETIKKLRGNGVAVSIMCMLHSGNVSTKEQRGKLGGWMLWLKKQGITGGRVNPIYSDRHPELEPRLNDLFQMWVNVYKWNKKYGLRWNPLIEMERNLTGENKQPQPCVHNKCDPFNTHTISVLPDGQIGCCDRTFTHGLYTRSLDETKSGRYSALEQIDCKDCKYWRVCHGGCPEEGIGGDWRRKTRFCEAIYKTYEYIEKDLRARGVTDLVIDKPVESVERSSFGSTHGDKAHGDEAHGDSHGDIPHGDSLHGDMEHGDIAHGDSDHGDTVDFL